MQLNRVWWGRARVLINNNNNLETIDIPVRHPISLRVWLPYVSRGCELEKCRMLYVLWGMW